MRVVDRSGVRSGRLLVVGERISKFSGNKFRSFWPCICDCGNAVEVLSDRLGITKSCGCLHRESTARINYKHGYANSQKGKEYQSWQHMKRRCYEVSNNRYHRYGGRGITVCDRWINSFENFLADMGNMPTGERYTIDRIDNDGNYEPSNCRWATYKQQAETNTGNLKYRRHGIIR